MSINMIFRQTVFVTFLLSGAVFAEGIPPQGATSGEALLKQQKETIDSMMVDLNKSGKAVYDTFTSEPMGVVESGCLSDLRGISLSAIVIDPYDIQAGIYEALKDEMYNMACSAASDKMNEITAKMEQQLELPLGMGSIGPVQGSGIGSETDNIFNTEIILDNNEAVSDITDSVLGDVRSSKYRASKNIDKIGVKKITTETKRLNSKELVEEVEKFLNVDTLWKGEKATDIKGGNDE